jgi:DNA-binding ferritin-like protein
MKNKSLKQAPKKALRKTDVSGRLSSYQKMKQKYEASIRQLTDDIITLVEEKDFMKTTTVKMQWRMRLDIEKAVWMGDATCH